MRRNFAVWGGGVADPYEINAKRFIIKNITILI